MSLQQGERAKQQLYEDSSLRDALTDTEAATLLSWGSQQISALAEQDLTDSAFEAAFSALRQRLSAINRYVGERPYLTAEAAAELLRQINPTPPPPPRTAAQAVSAQADPPADNLALLAWLTQPPSAPVAWTPPSSPDEPIDL